MFALFEDPKRPGRIERRAFCFGGERNSGVEVPSAVLAGSGDVMVVKAYRCKAKMRILPELEQAPKLPSVRSKLAASAPRQLGARSKSFEKVNNREYIR